MSHAPLFRCSLHASYYYSVKRRKTCVTSQMFRKRTKVKGILLDGKSTNAENDDRKQCVNNIILCEVICDKRVLHGTVGIYFYIFSL